MRSPDLFNTGIAAQVLSVMGVRMVSSNSQLIVLSWGQFTMKKVCERVCDTQNTQRLLIISAAWSRPKRNTVCATHRNTLRSTCALAITMTRDNAWPANGLALAQFGWDCREKSGRMLF